MLGRAPAVRGRNSDGTLRDVNGNAIDGHTLIDTKEIEAFINDSTGAFENAVTVVVAHEILHHAYGGHEIPRNATREQVRTDEMFMATIQLSADLAIGVVSSAPTPLSGFVVGVGVVSSQNFNRNGRQINPPDHTGYEYFFNPQGRVVYIVPPAVFENVWIENIRHDAKDGGLDGSDNLLFLDEKTMQIAAVYRRQLQDARTALYGELGGVIGSSLGSALAGESPARGIVYSSVLGELGERLGLVIAAGNLGAALESTTRTAAADAVTTVGVARGFGYDVWVRMQGAAVGTISSLLTAELGEGLGLEGFERSCSIR